MSLLVLGLLLFLGVHSSRIYATNWRTATISRIGPLPWKAIYSVVSIAAFVLLVYGYAQSRQQMPLWDPPAFMKHITALLMLPVFPMFLATYVPRNAIKAKLRHPQILSMKLWAFAHLLSNGNLADVLLFGGFLAWAVVDYRDCRKRDAAALGNPHDPGSAYSVVAPVATEGSMTTGTVICVVVGLAVYAAFVMGLHAWLIGVKPV